MMAGKSGHKDAHDESCYELGAASFGALPAYLRSLQPKHVCVDGDGKSVSMEFGGGFYHYGLHAYADDTATESAERDIRSKELIPGLWFYEEHYGGNQ